MKPIIILALAAAAASAQDVKKIAGVTAPMVDLTNTSAAPAQVAAMKQQVVAIIDVLKQMPVFAKPMGMIVEPMVGVGGGAFPGTRAWPLSGQATVKMYEYTYDGAKLLKNREGAEFGFTIKVNDLGGLFAQAPTASDAIGPMYAMPQVVADENGMRVGPWTFLRKSAEPLFVPVTKERVLKLRIAQVDSSLKDIVDMQPHLSGEGRKNVDATIAKGRAQQQKYRGWLASWSAAQKAAPAVISFDPENPFADSAEPGAGAALVEPNPKLFDLSRPADVQLIAVRDPGGMWKEQITAQINWAALRARLK